jgi:hypothetical protein
MKYVYLLFIISILTACGGGGSDANGNQMAADYTYTFTTGT